MNIVLLLNNDVASNLALNLLLPTLSLHKVSVFLSSKVGGNTTRPEALQRLAIFEQQNVFQMLGEQSKNSSDGDFKNFSEIATEHSLAIEILNDINSPVGVDKIRSLSPDVIISIRYGVILKKPIIDLVKHGVINLHSGALPAYRGVMATFWALLNDEKKLTATLHTITDSTIDTGGVIATATINVQPGKSYLWHVLSLYVGGCRLIEQAINNLSDGCILDAAEQSQGGHYYSFPNTEQVTDFVARYGELYQSHEIICLLNTLMPKNSISNLNSG
mgnify:FL=1